jgi:hypothetical protein
MFSLWVRNFLAGKESSDNCGMRDCICTWDLEETIKSAEILVLNQRYRHILDLYLVRPSSSIRHTATIHRARRSFTAILKPNIGPRPAAWVLQREVFESVGQKRCYLDKFVVEIGRISLQLANGNLFRFLRNGKYRQPNQDEDYLPRSWQQLLQSILTLPRPSPRPAPPWPSQ